MNKESYLREMHLRYKYLPAFVWNKIDKLPYNTLRIIDLMGKIVKHREFLDATGSNNPDLEVYQKWTEWWLKNENRKSST